MFHRWMNGLNLYLIIFLAALDYFIAMPVYSELLLSPAHPLAPDASMAERRLLFGAVLALAPLLVLFMMPVLGRASDVMGRKKMLLVCLGLMVVSFLLPIAAMRMKSIVLLMCATMVNSVASTCQPTAIAAIAERAQGRLKGYLIALTGAALCASMAFGPAIGDGLLHWGLDAPFLFGAGMAMVNALGVVLLFSDQGQCIEAQGHGLAFRAVIARMTRPIFLLLMVVVLCQGAWALYDQNLQYYLPEVWHASARSTQYASFFIGIGIAMILAQAVLFPLINQRISMRKNMMVSALLSAIGFLSMALTTAFYWHVGVVLLVSVLMAMTYPCYTALLSDHADARDQGWVLTLANSGIGLSWLVTGFGGAVLANLSLNAALWGSVVLLLLAFGCMACIRRCSTA